MQVPEEGVQRKLAVNYVAAASTGIVETIKEEGEEEEVEDKKED